MKIFGENPDDSSRPRSGEAGENIIDPDENRKFHKKPKYKQAIVLFAGIFANFLLAWILFSFGFMSGLPTSVGNEPEGYSVTDRYLVIISVLSGSPAEMAGLESGDKIISIKSGADFVSDIKPETLKSFIASHPNKEIEFGYLRDKEETVNTVKITPMESSTGKNPSIGVSMDEIGTVKLPVLMAFWEGLVLDWSVTKGTALGLYTLIKEGLMGRGSFASVTGPVGMVGIVGNASQFGFAYLLSFAALISVNLAIINLVPFPALDGGRLLFLLIEKIKGSPMNPKFANTANMVGFAILIILMLFITYHDVVKLF